MPADIERYIRELQNTVTTAELNFDIWWVYKDYATRPKYVDSMNRYSLFFQTSIHAHFVANIIALYRFYEANRQSININRVLKLLPPEKRALLPLDFDERLASAKVVWKRIAIVRNNCFGHLNGDRTVSDLFASAALTPDAIKALIADTKRLFNDLSSAWSRTRHAFNLDARGDVIRMLDDLNALGAQERDKHPQ